MNRRDFFKTVSLAGVALTLPRVAAANELLFNPIPADGWRTFQITTRVNPVPGTSHVWLPLPSFQDDTWVKPMGSMWSGNADDIRIMTVPGYGAQMLVASWKSSSSAAP